VILCALLSLSNEIAIEAEIIIEVMKFAVPCCPSVSHIIKSADH
jgi:hypothetical protein